MHAADKNGLRMIAIAAAAAVSVFVAWSRSRELAATPDCRPKETVISPYLEASAAGLAAPLLCLRLFTDARPIAHFACAACGLVAITLAWRLYEITWPEVSGPEPLELKSDLIARIFLLAASLGTTIGGAYAAIAF